MARISGKTIIARDVLPAREMYNANVFYTPPPAVHASVNEDSLDMFNAQLARDWTQQVQGASAREALSARASSHEAHAAQALSCDAVADVFSGVLGDVV